MIAMGGAGIGAPSEDASPLGNPAMLVLRKERLVEASSVPLSLDRSLIAIGYSQLLRRGEQDTTGKKTSTIGIAIGWARAATSNIDVRGSDAQVYGTQTTSENLFYGAFAVQLSPRASLGAMPKFYVSTLYDKTSTALSFGLDLGILYRLTPEIALGGTLKDLFTKYRWDTAPLYGTQVGTLTTNHFPLRAGIGATYDQPSIRTTVEYEYVSGAEASANILRVGVEVPLPFAETVMLRGGLAGVDITNHLSKEVAPTFGISITTSYGAVTPRFNYAFAPDPIAPGDRHVISLAVGF